MRATVPAGDRLRDAMDTEFLEEAALVGLERIEGNVQPLRRLLPAESLGQLRPHSVLLRR